MRTQKTAMPCDLNGMGRTARWVRTGGRLFGVWISGVVFVSVAWAQREDVFQLSFEQLSQVEITSVAKRPQSMLDVPATVRVITRDDIARSGASSLPELLRAAPGVNVAQISGAQWGVGVRGFQWQYASKLLVVVDGRSVYSPVFGGVYWDAQTYLMNDLDRIEVVLGPGSTMWGANAMNGVINIVTQSAKETLGEETELKAGTENSGLSYRRGWQMGEGTYARVFVKTDYTDATQLPSGRAGDDSMRMVQAGFRMDGGQLRDGRWTVQGDAYRGRREARTTLPSLTSAPTYVRESEQPTEMMGSNVLARWERAFSPENTWRLQGYYDYAGRNGDVHGSAVRTYDVELHPSFALGGGAHKIDWGLGYRWIDARTDAVFVTYRPDSYTDGHGNAFVQDEWALADTVKLTVGAKVERHKSTGWELAPSGKLWWGCAPHQALWLGYSRAIRQPTWIEQSGRIDARVLPPGAMVPGLPAVLHITGGYHLKSETMDAYELGWRADLAPQFGVEVSAFGYRYDQLLMVSEGRLTSETIPVPSMKLRAPYANGLDGESYGGEVMLHWDVSSRWRLRAGGSFARIQLHAYRPDPFDYEEDETTSPRTTGLVQSFLKIGKVWSLDATLRYVDKVPYYKIPGYTECDMRVAWRVRDGVEISLVGQNLLHARHLEYGPALIGNKTEIQRGVFLKIVFRN